MNEFKEIDTSPHSYYLRLYREAGKLRLQALKEPVQNPPRPCDFSMAFAGAGHHSAVVCIYFDNLEVDFVVNERIQRKILDYFTGAWFFRGH